MYKTGDVIDGKYRVQSVCSDLGGMGTLLHVEAIANAPAYPVVLKYCKAPDDESKARFSREVRYLGNLAGNIRVVQVIDSNLAVDPPYFVMKFYREGDLTRISDRIKADAATQEAYFNKMLDCIAELHLKGMFHRDIKPQNFLLEGAEVVASDLGLAKIPGVGTTFTERNAYWGTQGYLPPEFFRGGFKDAGAPSDIFMLGKTFYCLLSGNDPIYLTDEGIHPALYHVIERCCHMTTSNRYDSIASLRQDLKLAFDVMLGRASGMGEARQLLSAISSRLEAEHKYDPALVTKFLDLLAKLPQEERASVLTELPQRIYGVLSQKPMEPKLEKFLEQYEAFVRPAVDTWSYAEIVASNMKILFEAAVNVRHRAKALEIAIEGADWASRFAAMDTCTALIKGVTDQALGVAVAAVINRHRDIAFIREIDPVQCLNDIVRNAIRAAKDAGEAIQ